MSLLLSSVLLACPYHHEYVIDKGFKVDMINNAEKHRNAANMLRQDAMRMSKWLPDPTKQEHMSNLIISVFATPFIPNIIGKLASVGLALAGSLAANSYSNYCLFRDVIIKISYHLEMVDFYERVSLQSPEACENPNSKYLVSAIDHLTLCYMLASGIQEEGQREHVCEQLLSQRRGLLSCLNDKSHVSQVLYWDCFSLMEDINEMVCDVKERDIAEEICTYVCSMFDEVCCAFES